ncbi:MAG: hypothetical protein ACRC3Y_13740 [Romboutsia sp.]|uniref:hypothetical protein n=1 Tax=Romboutsia sp. TaxID=1965302 RepID=UPI003F2FCA46
MKRRNGYLLLENIISIAVISIIISILYYLLFFTYNTKTKLEDKVELQQQSNEIMKYIEDVIENSKGIISVNSKSINEGEIIDAVSIKCRYRNDNLDTKIKDKEISLKKNSNKIFINILNNSGNSESGGYEIGDYIDNIYVTSEKNGEFINIKLALSKNKEKIYTEFKINIRNFEGEKA